MLTRGLFDDLEPDDRVADVRAALVALAANDAGDRGAVFTRPEVANALLDLAGYVEDRPLHRMRLLEPSFGQGDILLPAVKRLLSAYRREGGTGDVVADLSPAIFAVELHAQSHEAVRGQIAVLLAAAGIPADHAAALCQAWLCCDDFLLRAIAGTFDVVVGNPPYVRQERIPAVLLAEYRRLYRTLFDRADVYVPFFERGLDLLGPGGRLSFICANRWIKNRYGGPLREKISTDFRLRYFVDMEGVDAFQEQVSAYPAIVVVERPQSVLCEPQPARVVSPDDLKRSGISDACTRLLGSDSAGVEEFDLSGSSDAPWVLESLSLSQLLRQIEGRFPTLEQAGCLVGIGVATGCDRVFIDAFGRLPVEPQRKLPLVMSRDLVGGRIQWRGYGVINPYEEDGRLAAMAAYPAFASYLHSHREALERRHVARRNPLAWYRTIDRIVPSLLSTPKLLVPDIKGDGVFVYDHGQFYPHHNLYYLTSSDWDLKALQTVLRSSLSLAFIAQYCTRMSGGFLRFQAQYLRRIRIPAWGDIDAVQRQALCAVEAGDPVELIDALVLPLYGLNSGQMVAVQDYANGMRVARRQRRAA